MNANWDETIWTDFMAAKTPRTLMSAANTPRPLIRTSKERTDSEFHENSDAFDEFGVEDQAVEAMSPADDEHVLSRAKRRVLEVCTYLLYMCGYHS